LARADNDVDKAIALAKSPQFSTTGEGRSFGPEAIQYLEDLKAGKPPPKLGKTYEVNIAADPEHFLDWDKPLSEQPKKVQQNLEPLLSRLEANDKAAGIDRQPRTWNFQQLYNTLAGEAGGTRDINTAAGSYPVKFSNESAASQALREAGIPGIKYLDQGSRITGDAGKMIDNYGSREKALEIAQQRLKSASMGDLGYWDNVVNQLKNPQTSNYVVFDDKLIDIIKKYGLAGLIAGGAAHFSTQQVDHDPFATQ
jgi:hypothetical protein